MYAQKTPFFLPDVPMHAIQRDHSREPVFFEDKDYQALGNRVKQRKAAYRSLFKTHIEDDAETGTYNVMTNQ